MKLRSPEFGNVITLDTALIVNQTVDGETILVHDPTWFNAQGFQMEFKALSREQVDAFIAFLIATAGLEIEYTDHENRKWLGVFTTEEPVFTQYGRGCQWSFEINFVGVQQSDT